MEYKTCYKNLSFLSIGGRWGYAIMDIVDLNDESKKRLAKCKKNNGFPITEKGEWEDLNPSEVNNLSQVNHVNFKRKEEVDACFNKLLEGWEDKSKRNNEESTER